MGMVNKINGSQKSKRSVRVNAALFLCSIAMLSLSASLMVKGDFGVSSVSCVPYIFSLGVRELTQGNWFFIMQGMLMIVLAVWLRRFKLLYVLSIGTAVLSGYLIDGFNLLLRHMRDDFVFRVSYLAIAIVLVSFGITLSFRTNFPIMAVDLFVIELATGKNWPLKKVKTIFDIALVSTGMVASFIFFHRLRGIGIGTVLSAVLIGQMVGYADKKLNLILPR